MQYFLIPSIFQEKPPFHHSMMTRLLDDPTERRPEETTKNQGKLLLDATCAPADIAYPKSFSLLNQVREKLERIIDEPFRPIRNTFNGKPRTYRVTMHKTYLAIAKQRRPGAT